ncbi:hypothetical protein DFJ74DRAFT_679801 [Hyaloraphidium curvatum]|nr:hypothetical protein DFJ74DRAFT_679801 [Hyaloraphidium curvatum]
MSGFLSSPLGIRSALYGLALYGQGLVFIRLLKDTWFSAVGGGLGLSPAAAQLALLAVGPPNAWLTIKGFELIGVPKDKIIHGVCAGLLAAGLLDGTSFLYPPFPYGLDSKEGEVRALSFLIWCNAWIAAAAVHMRG